MPRILHADLNSFFASVEQQYEPNLRGKPIGILKAVGRTCIIAASDEAKNLTSKPALPAMKPKNYARKFVSSRPIFLFTNKLLKNLSGFVTILATWSRFFPWTKFFWISPTLPGFLAAP